MYIRFDSSKHEVLVNNYEALCKKYNKKSPYVADEILVVIEALKAADCAFDIPRSYRPHPLKGAYKNCFAVDINNTHRVIFKPNHEGDSNFRIDNPKSIKSIIILEIYIDYHK